MRCRALPLFGLIALLGSACAFNNVPLTLPEKGLDPTLGGGRNRQVIVIVPFTDQRAIRNRCGMKKNGYNMDTADAVCQSDPSLWIANLLAAELRASGFQVVNSDVPHRAGAVVIQGALKKLFVEPVIGMWSGSLETDLETTLTLSSEDGLRAERTFFVKGVQKGVLLSTLDPYHSSLTRAGQASLKEMVTAIIELMDRYPQLGSAGRDAICTDAWKVAS